MKRITTLAFVLMSFGLNAQAPLEIPKTEFAISLSQDKISAHVNEEKEVTITLLRSKSYSQVKARFCVMGALPKGLSISFDPQEGKVDSGKATIRIGAEAAEGKHLIVLGAELSGKKKGSIVEIVIQKDSLASH